jgi:hypothetical protein
MANSEIDYSDIPKVTDTFKRKSWRPKFPRYVNNVVVNEEDMKNNMISFVFLVTVIGLTLFLMLMKLRLNSLAAQALQTALQPRPQPTNPSQTVPYPTPTPTTTPSATVPESATATLLNNTSSPIIRKQEPRNSKTRTFT